jgi:hypothetical protein
MAFSRASDHTAATLAKRFDDLPAFARAEMEFESEFTPSLAYPTAQSPAFILQSMLNAFYIFLGAHERLLFALITGRFAENHAQSEGQANGQK